MPKRESNCVGCRKDNDQVSITFSLGVEGFGRYLLKSTSCWELAYQPRMLASKSLACEPSAFGPPSMHFSDKVCVQMIGMLDTNMFVDFFFVKLSPKFRAAVDRSAQRSFARFPSRKTAGNEVRMDV